jgi:thioredoxin-dependent peroxiredoxin
MTIFSFSRSRLNAGDKLPNIELEDAEGNKVDLSQLKNSWHVLYFYPKDNTPGCTKQAINFSNLHKRFEEENIKVYGISTDKLSKHRKFISQHDLKVKLLTDEKARFSKMMGVKVLFGMCSRDTIIIDPEGKINKILRSVSPENNPKEVLSYILSLKR